VARFVFAGGGTGGHLFPAIAIADAVRKSIPDAEILFVGARGKIEETAVPKRGYNFRPIWISGFHRKKLFTNVLFPLKLCISMMQSISILRSYKPDVVIGTGGFASGPVLYAATMMGIPTLIQDQNSAPGVTTKFLGSRVDEVHLTFESSKKYLKRTDNVFISGNPIRDFSAKVSIAEANAYFGFSADDHKKTVLVFGGSLGAKAINSAMLAGIEKLLEKNIRVIWQTGETDFERVKASLRSNETDHPLTPSSERRGDGLSRGSGNRELWVNGFIERMDYAYAISDLVVCRAGATTIAELTALGKPAVLIPYPFAAADHQTENARGVAEANAAVVLTDSEATGRLTQTVLELIGNPVKLSSMAEASKKLGKPDAARVIAERAIALARKSN